MKRRKLILVMLACLLVLVSAGCGNVATEPESQVTPEFKAAMDSYEKFVDEYVVFVEKYKESGSPASMMSEMADYMTKYAETMQKIDDIDEENLSTEDWAYYTKVAARIMEKLAEVGEE